MRTATIVKSVSKSEINIFGENSLAVCEKADNYYQIRRLCDNKILCVGDFEKYKDALIRTMYTGSKFGTGDFVLEADFGDKMEVFHKFN